MANSKSKCGRLHRLERYIEENMWAQWVVASIFWFTISAVMYIVG